MDTTYDPDDQFFQAFKAGFHHCYRIYGSSLPPWGDTVLWEMYVTYLHEQPQAVAA